MTRLGWQWCFLQARGSAAPRSPVSGWGRGCWETPVTRWRFPAPARLGDCVFLLRWTLGWPPLGREPPKERRPLGDFLHKRRVRGNRSSRLHPQPPECTIHPVLSPQSLRVFIRNRDSGEKVFRPHWLRAAASAPRRDKKYNLTHKGYIFVSEASA